MTELVQTIDMTYQLRNMVHHAYVLCLRLQGFDILCMVDIVMRKAGLGLWDSLLCYKVSAELPHTPMPRFGGGASFRIDLICRIQVDQIRKNT